MAGWFRRREVWLPTWRTSLALLITAVLLGGWFVLRIHDWLSPRIPIDDAKYAIVEGWTPDPVSWAAVQWMQQHGIERIYTTGVPLDRGMMISQTLNYADVTAYTLRRMGADGGKIKSVPTGAVNTERTRAMARALGKQLEADNIPPVDRKIILFTLGTHAFRSHMHFQHELGPTWQVGVISVPNPNYPANNWWRYSEGVKSVINELVGIATQSIGID